MAVSQSDAVDAADLQAAVFPLGVGPDESGEANRRGLLRRIRALFGSLASREPAPRLHGNTGTDWLPPVLGPGAWSNGFLAALADSSAAWYVDRH